MRNRLLGLGMVSLALLVSASAATTVLATEFAVANNGVDSPTCGPPLNPCRSIGKALDLALDGDRIVVGPGIYSSMTEPDRGGSSLIYVDKQVSIRSTRGAAATVLEACPAPPDLCDGWTEPAREVSCAPQDNVVKIVDDNVTFGLHSEGGFTLLHGVENGLVIEGAGSGNAAVNNNGNGGPVNAAVKGNYAVGSGGNGFSIDGSEHAIERNTALNAHQDGFKVRGHGHYIARNRSESNGDEGFIDLGYANEYASNFALYNNGDGFKTLGGTGHVFTQNAATANHGSGFGIQGEGQTYIKNTSVANEIHGFNIHGNTCHSAGREAGLCVRGVTLPHVLDLNAVNGNYNAGIRTETDQVKIERNNIFGNDAADGNCGLANGSGVAIAAERNFWGVATGPSPTEPADNVCGDPIDSTPFSLTAYSILVDVEE